MVAAFLAILPVSKFIKCHLYPVACQSNTLKIYHFQLYTVYVMKTPCVDTDKAVIQKRFSDFYKLYKDLRKDFPNLLSAAPPFPKKVIGPKNYDQEVLQSRSRAFEKILQYIYSFDEICENQVFKEFFYMPDLREASMYIRGGKFRDALNLLINALHLQQKLSDDIHEIIATLGSIVAADIAIDNTEEAEKYAVAAIELIEHEVGNSYLIPLINTAIELRWRLGKDKRVLEEKLKDVKVKSGVEMENIQTLRQLACSRYPYTR